jgi:membrane protein DedA with SNARE-associated domain
MLDSIIAFVKAWPMLGPVIVFLLAFAESLAFLSLLVPSTALLLGLSALMAAAGVHFLLLLVVAGVGASLGYFISYWLGYHYHDQLLHKWPLKNYPEMVARSEAFFQKWGTMSVFVGHFFGPVRAVIPVIAGISKLSPYKFQLANIPSAFLWSFAVLAPGYGFSQGMTHFDKIKAFIGM